MTELVRGTLGNDWGGRGRGWLVLVNEGGDSRETSLRGTQGPSMTEQEKGFY